MPEKKATDRIPNIHAVHRICVTHVGTSSEQDCMEQGLQTCSLKPFQMLKEM